MMAQVGQLFGGLDPFGDHLQPQVMRQRDDRDDDRRIIQGPRVAGRNHVAVADIYSTSTEVRPSDRAGDPAPSIQRDNLSARLRSASSTK